MFSSSKYVLFILLFVFKCYSLEPITITTAAVVGFIGSVGYAGYKYIGCNVYECCDKPWIKFDESGLRTALQSKLFGQHLVETHIVKSIKHHIEKDESNKALVMSFHGGTGCGKNHVSKIIADNLYHKGGKSGFVHWYVGTRDFPHENQVSSYKDRLKKEIEEKTKLCERSMFVFDEVDKIPSGVLDVLTPYLDYHEHVENVNYRKNIFIFLSNAGTKKINQIVLKFFTDGINREKITMKDMERGVLKETYNEKGGLRHSDIIKRELIDDYIPFLPLQKTHLKLCIQAELDSKNRQGDVDEIANEFEFVPPNLEIFSANGCKKVQHKVGTYLM